MNNWFISTLFLVITIFIFYGSKRLYQRFPNPFTLPIFMSTFSIVIFLLIFDIPYQTYMQGGKWIDLFLGPIVVSLAVPLYRQRMLIKKYVKAITVGILSGSTVGIVSGIAMAKGFGFQQEIIRTIAAKSVTTPVALGVTDTVGGNLSLAAVFVMIAGISGAMIGPGVVKLFRISHPVARGLGIGTASHAIGTAKALELGELEGAVSALSMTISAVVVSLLVPFFIYILV
ncbi:LrgB family protein [Gracilibacillus sp. YIM 98692]|uniref:LrgB family protein n=1 Tax=Gracilibacillus sp. YIM 98692 TaxID=2663532 RepID=UPI0013D66D46|nr:LrgB family protein [Gracilibacillus sp. YIM 98692]